MSASETPERQGQRPGREHARTLHGRAAAPSLHVRACKAGGELILRAYQVAWAGRAILASRIIKHYIVYRRIARAAASLDENMHARYTGVPGHLAYM